MPSLKIIEADLSCSDHQQATIDLLDVFARDPMGDGKPLAPEIRRELLPGLRRHPTTLIFLAYLEGEPVGIAVCFLGFSTFAARSLINIHDLAVVPRERGNGVGRRLLEAIEKKARDLGCCRLTLEVQENNHKAPQVYQSAGFAQSKYVEESGISLFMAKEI